MATVEFRVARRRPHHRRRRRVPGLHHQGVRHRLPGQPVRAHGRRRHPLQLRAVLRVRHVLPGLQHRGRHHVDLPRGRPRRRLPAERDATASCVLKWVDLRPEVDPLTGAVHARRPHRRAAPTPTRPRSSGRCGRPRRGPSRSWPSPPARPAAEAVLREALAAGAHRRRARRRSTADAPSDDRGRRARPRAWPAPSSVVVRRPCRLDRGIGLGAGLPRRPARRGPGARARRGRAGAAAARSTVVRRLDGGRRERLRRRRPRRCSRSRARPPGCGGRRWPRCWPPATRRDRGASRRRPSPAPTGRRRAARTAPRPARSRPPRRRRPSTASASSPPAPADRRARPQPESCSNRPAAADRVLDALAAWGYPVVAPGER